MQTGVELLMVETFSPTTFDVRQFPVYDELFAVDDGAVVVPVEVKAPPASVTPVALATW